VAIIGNDAVLAAAPATPVQLAHACLRRGFTVAVPASWGDELVAAEAVRSLASRERGPAVMCVCPYARSRLLAPGPDLAPFLVSLVPPSVATARYLRAVYGERGIHITYVGACPGAEDSTIDARLTPDAFLADIAEHGISLLEQPLVFDSIVPPDRRRWCSLPGGVPTPEILWSETDARTLIEIDRDEISTDLAQHIITREHVLLDLAPSLGCACSGAISSLPPRSARVAVTALEPPRALSPVIDPSTVISLEVPLGERRVRTSIPHETVLASPTANATAASAELERRLDEILGLPTVPTPAATPEGELEAELDAELNAELIAESMNEVTREKPGDHDTPVSEPDTTEPVVFEPTLIEPIIAESEPVVADPLLVTETVETVEEVQTTIVVVETERHIDPILPTREPEVEPPESGPFAHREPEPWIAPAVSSHNAGAAAQEMDASAGSRVRRRTPPPMPARHPASVIPKATASDGRALPRAYVAKRRTPPGGAAVVSTPARPVESEVPRTVAVESPDAPSASPPSTGAPAPALPDPGTVAPAPPAVEASAPPPSPSRAPAREPPTPTKQPAESRTSAATAATSAADGDSNPSAIIVVLVALIALGFFVLRSLS
jgi:hypothetical protein